LSFSCACTYGHRAIQKATGGHLFFPDFEPETVCRGPLYRNRPKRRQRRNSPPISQSEFTLQWASEFRDHVQYMRNGSVATAPSRPRPDRASLKASVRNVRPFQPVSECSAFFQISLAFSGSLPHQWPALEDAESDYRVARAYCSAFRCVDLQRM
jgi:hypothetical protein